MTEDVEYWGLLLEGQGWGSSSTVTEGSVFEGKPSLTVGLLPGRSYFYF